MLHYTRRIKLVVPLGKADIYYRKEILLDQLNLHNISFTWNGFTMTAKQSKCKTK